MTGWVMKEHGIPDSKLTVIKEEPNWAKEHNLTKGIYYKCKCECGNEKVIKASSLRSKHPTLTCGCLTGKKIGNTRMLDLTGQRFGRWVVQSFAYESDKNKAYWNCICDCGIERIVDSSSLKLGKSLSCGCLHSEKVTQSNVSRATSLVGKQFGDWTVIEREPVNTRKWIPTYICRCVCGTEKVVTGANLISGNSRGCGCRRASHGEEKIVQLLQENNIFFEREKTFKDCINPLTGKQLKFDFYINNDFLLEFDGPQHDKPTGYIFDEEAFKKIKYRDNIKNQYCKEKGITLKRIPYKDLKNFTIQDILNNKYTISKESETYANA